MPDRHEIIIYNYNRMLYHIFSELLKKNEIQKYVESPSRKINFFDNNLQLTNFNLYATSFICSKILAD